jgi:DNA-binding CsgD family transcriptional regulator
VKRQVLIVESQADTRELLTRELAASGYSCLHAYSPHAALTQLRVTGPVDAIVVLAPRPDPDQDLRRLFQRAGLTVKERRVARHLLAGKTSTEIAALEQNSPRTIRQHISSIYSKCEVTNRADFFRMIYEADASAAAF